jgi:hypothetical protein
VLEQRLQAALRGHAQLLESDAVTDSLLRERRVDSLLA